MAILDEAPCFSIWLEGFLYGVYSGIFATYLQCPSTKSGTAIILFYAVCLLYVLSTVSFASDLVALILYTRFRTLSPQLQTDSLPMLFSISIIQSAVDGFCDFLAQSILIYRCWIVWGRDIRVVIIPLFLAIAYLGIWLAPDGTLAFKQGQIETVGWGVTLSVTSVAMSMAVNALVSGLIVFKILKVFLQVSPDRPDHSAFERNLGSSDGTKLHHIIFIVIESGMALFVIHLIRIVFYILPLEWTPVAGDYAFVINNMLNGIAPTIILVRVSMRLSFDDPESFKEATDCLRFVIPPSDPNVTSISMRSQLDS